MPNPATRDPIITAQVFEAGQMSPINLDVRHLCELALNGLVPMFKPEKQLFCFSRKRTPQGLVRQGLSHRYTIITLLGLRQCEATGLSSPIDIEAVLRHLLKDTAWINNIGDLGLLLWLCALVSPDRLSEVHAGVVREGVLERFPEPHEGRTTELAWFLSGLAHATLAIPQQALDLRGLAFQVYELLRQNQGEWGIFRHLSKRTIAGILRGRLGCFADQVYPIYALTQFARAFNVQAALEMARSCAEAISRLQGPQGQWWWHYDSITGRVYGKYPVYSVHQHGMAPMALFAVAEATRLDFTEPIYKGLQWITGKNELGCELRDEAASLIWRCIYHRNKFKESFSRVLTLYGSRRDGESLKDLGVNFECRPYELGWLLYAFAGRARATSWRKRN